jgi:hypothetical protein
LTHCTSKVTCLVIISATLGMVLLLGVGTREEIPPNGVRE